MQAYFLSLIRGERKGPVAWLLKAGLWLASFPYRWGMSLRNLAFERGWKASVAAPVPVLSVGNLTLGGTGKTPFVEYLAQRLCDLDLRVAILSRGYGSDQGCNDEALVLEENCPDVPHLQGRDRAALANTAVEELESQALILDDGFQHRRLRRDLDLVLIDATCPWGWGYLFPRGLLREPPSSLKRAHAAIITRSDLVPRTEIDAIRQMIAKHAPALPILETTHRPRRWINSSRETAPLEAFRVRPLATFCGIGNPDAFRRSLQERGFALLEGRTFPDHHLYSRDDIEDLRRWARQLPDDAVLATTQKDLVKIRLDRLGDRPLWAMQIQIQVQSGEELLQDLIRKIVPA